MPEAVIKKTFKSKKNVVSYVMFDGEPRVFKWFTTSSTGRMLREYQVLKAGMGKLNIPWVYRLDRKNRVIIMSYLKGVNLCDLVNNKDKPFEEKRELMVLLSKWLLGFHRFFKRKEKFQIRGDSNLRNFILADDIWGLDFEESRFGQPSEDLGEMCVSILTTDPVFTREKFMLCKTLIQNYSDNASWDIGDVDHMVSRMLVEKIKWRPREEQILRGFSERIKRDGLARDS